jgi:histidine triad (HIT) family protein
MNQDNCIFCKIIAGELPCTKVYEDERVLAFLDIGPLVKGHTLVIPKTHYNPLTAVPPELLAHMISVIQKLTGAMQKTLKADGINIHQANGAAAGQVVPHVHFHIVPRFETDNHHWNWSAKSYETPEEMTILGGHIAEAMKEKARG